MVPSCFSVGFGSDGEDGLADRGGRALVARSAGSDGSVGTRQAPDPMRPSTAGTRGCGTAPGSCPSRPCPQSCRTSGSGPAFSHSGGHGWQPAAQVRGVSTQKGNSEVLVKCVLSGSGPEGVLAFFFHSCVGQQGESGPSFGVVGWGWWFQNGSLHEITGGRPGGRRAQGPPKPTPGGGAVEHRATEARSSAVRPDAGPVLCGPRRTSPPVGTACRPSTAAGRRAGPEPLPPDPVVCIACDPMDASPFRQPFRTCVATPWFCMSRGPRATA